MGVKSQAATEYLMIVGFVIVILIPGIYLYMKYSSESKDSIINAKIDAISNEIVKAADQVYSYGEGSQTTLNINFPENIVSVEFHGKEIVFTVINSKGGVSEVAKVANVDMDGILPVIQGTAKIIVKSHWDVVSVLMMCNEGDRRCGIGSECGGSQCIMVCDESNKWDESEYCREYNQCENGGCVSPDGEPP